MTALLKKGGFGSDEDIRIGLSDWKIHYSGMRSGIGAGHEMTMCGIRNGVHLLLVVNISRKG